MIEAPTRAPAPTPREVRSGAVVLATRDYGGDGPPLVLLHGAGMDQRSLEPLASRLHGGFRVVTMDFRGHGRSSRAPWTVASAVRDLEAVVEAYGLRAPAVGGHSLGGVVAVAYGLDHPDCPGVVNIDGHGRGRTDQYVGYREDEVLAGWERQERQVRRLTGGVLGGLVRLVLLALRQPVVTGKTAREVLRESASVDHVAMYRRLACPVLVFNATAAETRPLPRLLSGEGLALVAAYRRGLVRDLAAIAAEKESVEVATVDAQHTLHRTHPDVVAARIAGFLARAEEGRP